MKTNRLRIVRWLFIIACWSFTGTVATKYYTKIAQAKMDAKEIAARPFTYKVVAINVRGNGLHTEEFTVCLLGKANESPVVYFTAYTFDDNLPMAAHWLRMCEGDRIVLDYNTKSHDPSVKFDSFNYLTPRKIATL